MPRINRRKSIHTPPRRDRVTASKRAPMPDDGPTEFALQRKAEVIGQGTYSSVDDHRVGMTGGPGAQSRAEFASSSACALLLDQGKLLPKQYRAGNEYGRLHRVLFGSAHPRQSGLSKVLASSVAERLEASAKASREEMDDDAYLDWIADQRTLYERGEYRLRHIAGETHVSRRLIRIVVRAVVIDNLYPNKPGQLWRLRLGLNELANTWGME